MRGEDYVVADALSRMFEGDCWETPEMKCAALLQSLPLVYSSLEEHQRQDAFCTDLRIDFRLIMVAEAVFRFAMVCCAIFQESQEA
jgi:hypothetical protein